MEKKQMGIGTEIVTLLRVNVRNYAMYIALAVIFIIFQILSRGHFLTARNLTNLINQTGYIAVMAVGMTLVLIICQIDLSVGFAAGFLGACAARLMLVGLPAFAVVPIILLMGAAIGFLQGEIIGRLGVPAFVTTLAGEFAFRGLLSLVTESTGTVPVTNESFITLSNGCVQTAVNQRGVDAIAGFAAYFKVELLNVTESSVNKILF